MYGGVGFRFSAVRNGRSFLGPRCLTMCARGRVSTHADEVGGLLSLSPGFSHLLSHSFSLSLSLYVCVCLYVCQSAYIYVSVSPSLSEEELAGTPMPCKVR